MAGAGYRTWTAGEVVTASNVQSYLQDQTVGVYAGTAARASAILSPSEGQVSYRTDDDIVEVYDGTAWQPIAPADTAGLVHIKTVSFSGAVSHSFGSDADPIFTSDYTNYKIILDDLIGITGDQDISFRIRANTTDLTANDYRRSIFVQDGTSVTGSRSALTSTGFLGSIGLTNDKSSIVVEIQNPQTTKRKTVLTYNVFSSTSTGVVYKCSANTIANTSAYNGFSIFGAYNFSGTMSVYGYKI